MCHDRKQRGPYFVVRHRRTRYPSGPNLTRGFDNALEFRFWSSSVTMLPTTSEANSHCGLTQAVRGNCFAASSIRRFRSSTDFERRYFRADQSEDDNLALGYMAQWLKAAGPWRIVFEQKPSCGSSLKSRSAMAS